MIFSDRDLRCFTTVPDENVAMSPDRRSTKPPSAPGPKGAKSTISARISRSRGAPLWKTISRSMEKDIVSGRLAAGLQLPTETALSRQFSVNRHTLRRAIADLAKKGLIRHVPQSGTFVAPLRIPFAVSAQSRISDAIERAGFKASARLLSERVCTPPPEVARQLGIAERTPVVEVAMLRYANDIPIAYVTAWLPADRFGDIAKIFVLTGSMRRAIVKIGVAAMHRKSMRIVSRTGDDEECARLCLESGTTLLTLEVVDVDQHEEPIAVFVYRFCALRTEFVVEN